MMLPYLEIFFTIERSWKIQTKNYHSSIFVYKYSVYTRMIRELLSFHRLKQTVLEQTVLDSFLFEMISIRRIKGIGYEEEKCWIDVLVLVQSQLVSLTSRKLATVYPSIQVSYGCNHDSFPTCNPLQLNTGELVAAREARIENVLPRIKCGPSLFSFTATELVMD